MGQSITPEWRRVEAGVSLDLGDVAIVTEQWSEYLDIQKISASHYLQLSLVPMAKNAIGGFPDRWGPTRFARMGPLFLLPAGQLVRARGDCRMQRSIRCRFDADAMSRWFDQELEWTDKRLTNTLDIACPPIRHLLGRIVGELRVPRFGSEPMVELMVAQIGIELSRYFLNIRESTAMGGLAPWRLRLIDDYLAVSAGSATLSLLAGQCQMSVRHLARAYRESRGQSLGQTIAERRFDEACRMLDAGASIKETAGRCGFTATANFTTAFRRVTGTTPRQYRQHALV